MALAMATPTAMIAPMNDWMLSVVRVRYSISTTPATAAGAVETATSANRSDWKFAASKQEDHHHGQPQPHRPARRASRASAESGRGFRP